MVQVEKTDGIPLAGLDETDENPDMRAGFLSIPVRALMARLLSIAVVLSLLGCAKRNEADSLGSTPPASTVPQTVLIETTSHSSWRADAGAVFRDTTPVLHGRVTIRNSENRMVRFEEIRKSCSCATATIDRMDLGPGEETVLHLTVNLAGRSGKQQIACELVEAGGKGHIAELTATVYESFKASVATVSFGDVRPRQAGTAKFYLEAYATSTEKLPAAVSPTYDAKLVKSLISPAQTEMCEYGVWRRSWSVEASLSEGGELGPHQEMLSFSSGSGEPVSVMSFWSVNVPYRADPPTIFIKNEGSATSRSKTIQIRKRGAGRSVVRNATSPVSGVSATVIKNMSEVGDGVRVEVDAIMAGKPTFVEVIVEMEDEDSSVLTIQVAIEGDRKQ